MIILGGINGRKFVFNNARVKRNQKTIGCDKHYFNYIRSRYEAAKTILCKDESSYFTC